MTRRPGASSPASTGDSAGAALARRIAPRGAAGAAVPQQFTARFVEAEAVLPAGAIVRLVVPSSVASAVTPGQFLLLGNSHGRDPLLPRPYSIMRAARDGDDGLLDLLVFTGGRGASQLAAA